MSARRKRSRPSGAGPSRHSAAQARQAAADRQRLEAHRRQRRLIWTIALAVVLVVVGVGVGFQIRETYRAPTAPMAVASPSAAVDPVAGEPIVWGSAGAPVTVDLWSDFHCPHCVDFESTYGPVLRQEVGDGRIRLRTFPLAFIDSGSRSASNAYACAAQAGFAEPYFTALFADPDLRWSDHQLRALFVGVSGRESAAFDTCVAESTHEDWVTSLSAAGEQAGVTATPTLVVDGRTIDIDALTPESLTTTIEEAAQS